MKVRANCPGCGTFNHLFVGKQDLKKEMLQACSNCGHNEQSKVWKELGKKVGDV